MLKVVGIAGKQNSGKDTLANVFVDHGYVKMSFADPLKVAVKHLFRISERVLWGNSEMRDPRTRNILQVLGTDIVRKLDTDIWITRLFERINEYATEQCDYLDRCEPLEPGTVPKIVVPDVRFPAEAHALRTHFGAPVILISRPDVLVQDTWSTLHESETAVDDIYHKDITHSLVNDGSLKQLLTRAEELIKEIHA